MQLKRLGLLTCALAILISSPRLGAAANDPTTNTSLPFLSPMFGDEMVLQRGKPNTFWGWARPGEKITVTIADQSATASAGNDGRWQAKINPPAPGGPYTVKITGSQTVELHDVLVGDVWLCGGQSNMELGLARARNGVDEVKAADHPALRLFKVRQHTSYSPAASPQGNWKICSPATVIQGGGGGFSAVAYFFGTKLQDELHIPIGLIEDCVGGTTIETWMNQETLGGIKYFAPQLAQMPLIQPFGGDRFGNYVFPWYEQYDIGLKPAAWSDENFDDSNWKTVNIPGGFTELGLPDTPSVCWFRKEIWLPAPLSTEPSYIYLGAIEQMDTTFINGQRVGAGSLPENPRVYAVAPGLLKPGRNIIAIRVFKTKPNGGFLGRRFHPFYTTA